MVRPFNPDLVAEPQTPAAYTVTEINALARRTLERNFRSILVVGEVSNLHVHRSGHVYFALKDDESRLEVVMWRTAAAALSFDIEDGMEVLAFGDLSIYTAGGRYQMLARTLEPRGVGALELAFRQVKARLEKEGLFDAARKKPLPFLPGRIALVTSPQGAAVRDMIKSIYSRFSRARVALFPVAVQGEGAPAQIAGALRALNADGGFDVIVVGRGGGSLEDLWAFNEESVARAIAASQIPVVSAVGHERDVTISDLVADARAMTPTEVGMLVVPDERLIIERLEGARRDLVTGLVRRGRKAREGLAYAWRRGVFARPEMLVVPRAQKLDAVWEQACRGIDNVLKTCENRLQRVLVALETLSPLAVLARGYSVTMDKAGNVIGDASGLSEGDLIETILKRARVESRVSGVYPTGELSSGEEGQERDV